MSNVKKIRGFILPGTPWATSACCGVTFTFTNKMVRFAYASSDSDCVQKWQMELNQVKEMLQNAFRLDAPISGYVCKANIDTVGLCFVELSTWNLNYILPC